MLPTQEQEVSEYQRREKKLKEYLSAPEYLEKLKLRLKLQDAGNHNTEAKQHLWNLCYRENNPVEGCIFFIENFGWTFSPKTNPKHLPFILFDYQRKVIADIIDHIDKGEDIFIEKSRDMGVSWLVFVYVPLWYWLFRDGVSFLLGSYKEALVDNFSEDSLMGKLDYAIRALPKWILPKGFNIKNHRTKMKLVNPLNNNLISGDTMNPNFGRGSRKTAILFDELGFWDYAKDAWEASGDSTNCRIANSTPAGFNYYAMLRESGIDILTLHWKLHPLKDNDWYEFEKSRRTEEEVAQELDISYSKSREGRIYPEWNENNIEKGFFPYDDNLPLYISWDFGKSDDTAIIWSQLHGNSKLRIIDTYRNTGKNIDFYVPFVTGIISSDIYKYSKEDLKIIEEHKEWKSGIHFGDPAGRFSNQISDDTVIDVLKRNGININFKEQWKEFKIRKSAGKRRIMDGILLNENPRTKYFEICMINSSYPKVKVEGVDIVNSEKPKHNSYCLTGDTKIRTLDGWIRIEDLVDKDFYVWSFSFKEGRLIPTKAGKCWKSGINRDVIEVGLDNGKSIKCTPDHKFMLRDGKYKEAQDLKKGDSLMPFYERNNSGYPQILLNDGSFATEHKYVYSHLIGNIDLSNHIDHIDGNKTNNNPNNLQSLTPNKHCQKTFRGKSMNERVRMSSNVKPYKTDYSADMLFRDCLYCGKEIWTSFKQFYCDKKCTSAGYRKRNNSKQRIANNAPSSSKENKLKYSRIHEEKNKKPCAICGHPCHRRALHCIKCKGNGKTPINHKVRFIKHIEEKYDVYDIEVPEYNNFVAEGVILHNSHYRSSFEYLCMGLENLGQRRKAPLDRFPKKNKFREVSRIKRRIIGY